MNDRIANMAAYHLENLARSHGGDEKIIQITSRIPASLKIRLDLCASFLDLTRNSFLIDLLEASLPTVEQALRDAQSTRSHCGIAGSWGPYSYDEAVKAFTDEYNRTGKEFKSINELGEVINQANLEFAEKGEASPETKTLLRELGYPERFLDKEGE